jgi:hypothetical protein
MLFALISPKLSRGVDITYLSYSKLKDLFFLWGVGVEFIFDCGNEIQLQISLTSKRDCRQMRITSTTSIRNKGNCN